MSEAKIKKTFQPIHEVLVANQDSTVADIMDQVVPLMSAKTGGGASTPRKSKTIFRDALGNPVAIRCYYYGRWMPLVGDAAVEFGKKAGSNSGYNSMSKDGLSHWNKQNSEAKKALSQILVDIEAGELDPSGITDRKAEIEANRKYVAETDLGFETVDAVADYLEDEGIELGELPTENDA